MVAAIVLGTVLRFTYPDAVAWPGTCDEGPMTLDDLFAGQLVLIRGADTIWTQPRLAVGMEGRPDSFVVELNGAWQAFVRTCDIPDTNGPANWSCPSNVVAIMGTAPLDAPVWQTPEVEMFDLAGRRVRAPFKSGVYFRRERLRGIVTSKRIVVIR